MSSFKHYRYLNNVGTVIGYATVNDNDEIIKVYEIDPDPPRVTYIEKRNKEVPTLKHSTSVQISNLRRCATKQAIIIAHISQFDSMDLPTVPFGFDGVYVVQEDDVPDAHYFPSREKVYNSILKLPGNIAVFPIYEKDLMNSIFQTRMDIRNEIKHQLQSSRGQRNISIRMPRISKEVMNVMLERIQEAALYVSSGREDSK
jgi:hypothetical protein